MTSKRAKFRTEIPACSCTENGK